VDQAPLSIVWRCALDVTGYAAAGRQVAVPPQTCPECGRRLGSWSGYWRWARAPRIGEQRVWIRRGRCSACRRRHALVPDWLLVRRLDAVETIGYGLALTVRGLGLRTVAQQVTVPHTTVRSWWRRFRVRSPTLVAVLAASAVGLDPAPVVLGADGEGAVLAALAVAWQRARARWGERVGGLWRFWSRVTGGRALGTPTTAPLAGSGPAGWIAPSP
jgi:uncharacterized protein DUF6431